MVDGKPSIYSPFKMLAHLDRIQSQKPVFTQIDLTNRCNQNCQRCSSKLQPNYDAHDEWQLQDILNLATQLKKAGIKAIEITGGGEPLCHPRCKEIFREMLDMGFEMALVTNGSLLDNDLREILSEFVWVRISIDAFSRNTYRLLHHAEMPNFSLLPATYVGASFVIQPENMNEIVPFASWAASLGFDNVRYTPCYHPQVSILQNDIEKIITTIQRINVGIPVINQAMRLKTAWNRQYTGPCYYSKLVKVVAADGREYFCCTTKNDNRYLQSQGEPEIIQCPPCWMDEKNKIVDEVLHLPHLNFA
jgi:sulfatase maturation enzyme AslB (radical SAM superfamily)